MNKIPKTIYLQIGDECPDDIDFDKLTEVGWCADKIYKNDIEYKLKSKHGKLFTELGKLSLNTDLWSDFNETDYDNGCKLLDKLRELE